MATDLRRTSRVVGMFRLAPLHRAFSRAGLTERPLPDTRPDLGRCSKGFPLRDSGDRRLGLSVVGPAVGCGAVEVGEAVDAGRGRPR